MEELTNILMTQVSIWAPSAAAIIGIVISVLKVISCINTSMTEAKTALQALKSDKTFKDLAAKLDTAIKDNAVLKQQNDILIDEIKRIKGYREAKYDKKAQDR
jgi:hypothetical protein